MNLFSIRFAVLLVAACGSASSPNSALPSALLPALIQPAESHASPGVASDESGFALRIRVYAGAENRARLLDWQGELRAVVAQSSALLQGGSGLQLELVESLAWERSGGPLAKTLSALVALDASSDVDLVVGLVDASDSVSTAYSELVAEGNSARHIVVRSFSGQAEGAALDEVAPALGEEARDRVLALRRRHKQSVLLAEGVAMAYGVKGAFGSDYRPEIREFGAAKGAMLRAAAAAKRALWAKEKAARREKETTLAGARSALRRVDTETLAQVYLLLDADKPSVAWEILEPLIERYPERVEIANAGCLTSQALESRDDAVWCGKAEILGSERGTVYIALGQAFVSKDPERAAGYFSKAERLLAADDPAWPKLALAYKNGLRPTAALRASSHSAHSAHSSEIARWATEVTIRYGVAVGVAEAQESDYLGALQQGLKRVYRSEYKQGLTIARDLDRRYPKSVAGPLLRCETAMRRGRYPAALEHCQKVLRVHKNNSWARYLLGVARARQQQTHQAITSLRQAIALDSTLEPAYKLLAQIYRKSQDTRLRVLRSAYKNIFDKRL